MMTLFRCGSSALGALPAQITLRVFTVCRSWSSLFLLPLPGTRVVLRNIVHEFVHVLANSRKVLITMVQVITYQTTSLRLFPFINLLLAADIS